MLHIIWGILRILGILLLALLALAVVLLLLILFVPIRYRLQADMQEEICVEGKVSWFLHLLYISAEYRNKKLRYFVKVLGRTLISSRESGEDAWKQDSVPESWKAEDTPAPVQEPRKAEDTPAPVHEPRKAEETPAPVHEPRKAEDTPTPVQEHRKAEETSAPVQAEEDIEEPPDEAPDITQCDEDIGKTKMHAFQKLRRAIAGIKQKIDRYTDFWHHEKTQAAFRHVKREAGYLLRHFRPRKLEGNLLFGTGDPAGTGKILGILCVMQGFAGNRLLVDADFENKVLKGHVFLKGHVRGCHFAKTFLGLLFDKNLRITIKRFLKIIKE